jgi:hypothetical protein
VILSTGRRTDGQTYHSHKVASLCFRYLIIIILVFSLDEALVSKRNYINSIEFETMLETNMDNHMNRYGFQMDNLQNESGFGTQYTL